MDQVFANGSSVVIDAVTAGSLSECQDIIEQHGYPTDDPFERLRHFLALHPDTPDDAVVLPGTWGVYPGDATVDGEDGGFTGVTKDDLRAIIGHWDSAR